MAFYGSKRLEIGKILRKLCEWKGVNIIEAKGGLLDHYSGCWHPRLLAENEKPPDCGG